MAVRARVAEDLDALVGVARRVRDLDGYPAFLPGGDFYRFLTRPESLAAWVAESDGSVVGHVALNSQSHPAAMAVVRDAGIAGEVGVVARLLVDPLARAQGIGALLLQEARVEAVRRGRIPVLDVVASSTPAIGLYLASGWKELGRCRFEISGHEPIEEIIFVHPAE